MSGGKWSTIRLDTFTFPDYSTIGLSLSGLELMPESTPGNGATGSVSKNSPVSIHFFRILAISTALG
jgi:hypothetical protein